MEPSHLYEPTPAAGDVPSLRADAANNRLQILHAADRAFRRDGVHVPLAVIARQANVGLATLYRRFPSRRMLLTVLHTRAMNQHRRVLSTALAYPDPVAGLGYALHNLCGLQLAGRACTPAFTAEFPETVSAARTEIEAGLSGILERAQAGGRVHADIDLPDLTNLLGAIDGIIASGTAEVRAAVHRHVAFFIRGIIINN